MNAFLDWLWSYLSEWDGATVSLLIGCLLIYIDLGRALQAQKSINKRLDDLCEIGSNKDRNHEACPSSQAAPNGVYQPNTYERNARFADSDFNLTCTPTEGKTGGRSNEAE